MSKIHMFVALGLVMGVVSCSDDSNENTGQSCDTASQCYPSVAHEELSGAVICMDRVESGYCTHTCQTDADCCKVEGECKTGFPQVCAPFESTDAKYCFLSCEDEDVGENDPTEYCHANAHEAFGCRSTGGGNENRKVCVP